MPPDMTDDDDDDDDEDDDDDDDGDDDDDDEEDAEARTRAMHAEVLAAAAAAHAHPKGDKRPHIRVGSAYQIDPPPLRAERATPANMAARSAGELAECRRLLDITEPVLKIARSNVRSDTVPVGGEPVSYAPDMQLDRQRVQFTPEQRKAFAMAFNQTGKAYHAIAAKVPGADTPACVMYYYYSKTEKYRRIQAAADEAGVPPPGVHLGAGEGPLPQTVHCACCDNVTTARQFNAMRAMYRARSMQRVSWRAAAGNPHWLCLDCFPAPVGAVGLDDDAEEVSRQGRKRRRAAILADTQRQTTNMPAARLATTAESVFVYGPDGGVDAVMPSAAAAVGVRGALMQCTVTAKDAVSYVSRVQEIYGANHPRYRRLLHVLSRYMQQELTARCVAKRVLRLFRDNVPLLRGFAIFLPPALRHAFEKAVKRGIDAGAATSAPPDSLRGMLASVASAVTAGEASMADAIHTANAAALAAATRNA